MLQFLAFPDIKVAPEKRTAIYEALGLMNEQLWLGHFEMWSGSGLIVFRHATILDTRENDGLTLDQAESIIEAALEAKVAGPAAGAKRQSRPKGAPEA